MLINNLKADKEAFAVYKYKRKGESGRCFFRTMEVHHKSTSENIVAPQEYFLFYE